MISRLFSILAVLASGSLPLHAQSPKSETKNAQPMAASGRIVKKWTFMDLEGLLGAGLEGGRHYYNGRKLFNQATCISCHRFNQEGSETGHNLDVAAVKYGPSDLLMHIIEPSRVISDPDRQQELTLKDGSRVLGRILSMTADKVTLNTDMSNPGAVRTIERKSIKSTAPSNVSIMPPGLLDKLVETDILDLLAYILSKGDSADPMFR